MNRQASRRGAAVGAAGRAWERLAYAAMEALQDSIAVVDAEGIIVAVNGAWRKFARENSPATEGLMEGASYVAACERAEGEEAADAARFLAGFRAVIDGESDEFLLEYPCHAAGCQRWFVARITRFEVDGEAHAVVAHYDITTRKQAEQRLAQSEEQLSSIFQASRDGILVEHDERIVYVNSAYARLFGYDQPEELIGKRISIVPSPVDAERMLDYGRRRLRGETAPTAYEFRGRHKSGALIDLEASVSTHSAGGRTYITTMIRDIAARKAGEEALRQSERKYRLLLEQASDGIHTYDLRGNFIDVNLKLCEMLGYTRDELLRLNVEDLIPPQDLAAAPIRFDKLQAGETVLSERRLLRKDGTLLPVEISGRMISDGVLQSIIRDISERKQAEENLRRAYDELERRVNERTHELAEANETLKAEIAERQRAEDARRELLMRLVDAQEEERRRISRELHDHLGQRMAALMLGLKTLDADAHGGAAALPGLLNLQALADNLTSDLHALAWGLRPPALDDLGLHTALYNYVEEWAERARVTIDFHSQALEGRRLPHDIEITLYRIAQEALTNILKHARANHVSVVLEHVGEHVIAVIEDDGCGFDAEGALKPSGRGHKLGLLGMNERVSMLGGVLSIESTCGVGTSVFVRIPLKAAGGAAEERTRVSERRNERE